MRIRNSGVYFLKVFGQKIVVAEIRRIRNSPHIKGLTTSHFPVTDFKMSTRVIGEK